MLAKPSQIHQCKICNDNFKPFKHFYSKCYITLNYNMGRPSEFSRCKWKSEDKSTNATYVTPWRLTWIQATGTWWLLSPQFIIFLPIEGCSFPSILVNLLYHRNVYQNTVLWWYQTNELFEPERHEETYTTRLRSFCWFQVSLSVTTQMEVCRTL